MILWKIIAVLAPLAIVGIAALMGFKRIKASYFTVVSVSWAVMLAGLVVGLLLSDSKESLMFMYVPASCFFACCLAFKEVKD